MRTENTIKNVSISIISAIVIALLGFISRKVFLDNLGTEYLGINGLLTNVLSMLGLVESGIGASIVYNLYKPLAIDDRPKIIALVQIYKKAYKVLALVVFVLSLLLYPFLGDLMKGKQTISYITVVYFLFVAKNVVSYLNAHKVSLINADQKGYVLSRVNFGFTILIFCSKIIVLILTQNFILYLLMEFIIFTIQNIVNGNIVEKKYFYIRTKERYFIDETEKDQLIKNIKALFFHRFGTFCVFGTDNMLISSFVGIVAVGLYSNYTMIIGQLSGLVSPILSGINASVGNLIASESNEKSYSVFKVSYLLNFWIYSVCVIFLYNLLEPFINWWLGKGYLLDYLTFTIILVNFYITGMRSSIMTFKDKGGIFVQDKYMPLIEAAINLIASIILVNYIGLAGIFIGTTISTLSIVFWNVPRLVYKHIFEKPLSLYFKNYLYYSIITVITCAITTYLCHILVEGNNFISLVARGLICVIFPNIIYLALFYKSEEIQYIKSILKARLPRIRAKLKSTGTG